MGKKLSTALGIFFLACLPFQLAVNFVLSKIIGKPVVDVWDLLDAALLLLLALISFACGHAAALRGSEKVRRRGADPCAGRGKRGKNPRAENVDEA